MTKMSNRINQIKEKGIYMKTGIPIMMIFLVFIMIVLTPTCFSDNISDGELLSRILDRWKKYVAYPSSDNASELYNTLPSYQVEYEINTEYDDSLESLFKDIDILAYNIYSGDVNALLAAFRLYNVTDGYYTEILDILLGRLIRINPSLFLSNLSNNIPSELPLDGILCNLGTLYVDNDQARILEYKLRIKALYSVETDDLKSTRNKCINKLKSCIDDILAE